MKEGIINKLEFRNTIWIAIAVFFVYIFAKAITDTNILYLLLIAAPVVIIAAFKKPLIFPFGLYLLLLPFDSVAVLTGGKSGPTLTKLLGALTILVFTMKGIFEKKFKKPDTVSLWWLFFVCYCLLSSVWAVNPSYVFSRVPTMMGLFLLYFVVAMYRINQKEFDMLKKFVIAGAFFAALLVIYNYREMLSLAGMAGRTTLKLAGRGTELNNLALMLLVPIAFNIEKIIEKNSIKIKLMYIGSLITLLFALMLTGSRGNMLAVGVMFLVLIFSIKERLKYGIALILIIMVVLSYAPSFVIERWEAAIESGGSGRTSIWYVGLLLLKDYWLLGAGLDNFPSVYGKYAYYAPHFKGVYRASHNIYLGFLVDLGIPGFLIMLTAMIKHYRALQVSRAGKFFYDQIMLKAAFWAVLVSSTFLDTVWKKSFWLLWMMMIIQRNINVENYNKMKLYGWLNRWLNR